MVPNVGDIIAFHNGRPVVSDSEGDIRAFEADQDGATCLLQVKSMTAAGSSMIVEAIDPTDPAYIECIGLAAQPALQMRCPKDSDLLLSREGLIALATAAGGFGVDSAIRPEVIFKAAFARGQQGPVHKRGRRIVMLIELAASSWPVGRRARVSLNRGA